jgi:hypothetical protein
VVLPVWATESDVSSRAEDLRSKQTVNVQTEADRVANLKRRQAEEDAKRKAEQAQLEERQKRYRAENGPKVASLVSATDNSLKSVRDNIDSALAEKKNLRETLAKFEFWGDFPEWYADKRMKGWEFDSTVPAPKNYGVAIWGARDVEAVVAKISVLMKNRELGAYSDDCWNVGYLVDKEFAMRREPFVQKCGNDDAYRNWQSSNRFETRWDLGVR